MTAIPLKVAQEAENAAISYPRRTSRRSSPLRASAINFARISFDPRQEWSLRVINYPLEKESSQSDMKFSRNRSKTPMERVLKKKFDSYEKTVYSSLAQTPIRQKKKLNKTDWGSGTVGTWAIFDLSVVRSRAVVNRFG